MSPLPAQAIRLISRHWIGRLSNYRLHRNDEHREALIAEAVRYVGIRLETDLGNSEYWGHRPLLRRAAVLLYLVDRGAVERRVRGGRIVYEPVLGAERWVASQASLVPYLAPTFELLTALHHDLARRQLAADGPQ